MWQPIEDLPSNYKSLGNSEVLSLLNLWKNETSQIKQSKEFTQFMEQMRREIAVETGIVERLYSLDRGTTQLLIEEGLNASLVTHTKNRLSSDQIINLISDQEQAVEGLFDFVGNQRSLSNSYIKQLHQVLTTNQDTTEALTTSGEVVSIPLLRGEWKRSPNNPLRTDGKVHTYCPPEQVSSQMDYLIHLHREHLSKRVSPEVEAAWLHHRFAQIHPFQDGNGRVARCLASLVFIQSGWFPLVLTRDDRNKYLDALEDADEGNLSSLINLFSSLQRRSVLRALSIIQDVTALSSEPLAILSSIADKLNTRKESKIQAELKERQDKVEAYASTLYLRALSGLEKLAGSIQEIVEVHPVITVSPEDPMNKEVIEVAKELNYTANLSYYHTWMSLTVKTSKSPVRLVLSFHGIGQEPRGVLLINSFNSDTLPLINEPFTFNYSEEEDVITPRFDTWLKSVISKFLNSWYKVT